MHQLALAAPDCQIMRYISHICTICISSAYLYIFNICQHNAILYHFIDIVQIFTNPPYHTKIIYHHIIFIQTVFNIFNKFSTFHNIPLYYPPISTTHAPPLYNVRAHITRTHTRIRAHRRLTLICVSTFAYTCTLYRYTLFIQPQVII